MKPLIVFTKLDSQGNLTKDTEKTQYYADHPDELSTLCARMNLSKVKLKFIKKGTKDFDELIKIFTEDKTDKMISAENIMFTANMKIPKFTDAKYLNTLCQQIVLLMQNNNTTSQILKLCKIDLKSVDWMQQILNTCISQEVLFDE